MSAAVVMAAAGVTALVMVSAGMPLTVVVVAAYGVGIVGQAASQQGLHLGVRTAGRTGVELNPRLSQGAAGAAADAAADQGVHSKSPQETRQGAMAGAACLHHPGGDHLALRRLVDFELLRMAKVLKNLSVYDNIILPAYQSVKGRTKQGRKEINAYAAKLMQKLGISEIADNDVNEVSGGQLQRACICRSLINHPRILFADEPTGALNKQSSHEVMEELNRIHKEGTSILLVTHDMKVASRCDRVLYIEDGNIRDEMQLGAWEDCTDIRKRERRLNEWLITLGW